MISNFFSSLKNNNIRLNNKIKLKKTKIIIQILNLLIKEGLIYNYKLNNKNIYISLKYYKNNPLIFKIKMISKSNKRVYIKNKDLFLLNTNNSLFLISTVNGLMTVSDAKQKNLGGELICKICL